MLKQSSYHLELTYMAAKKSLRLKKREKQHLKSIAE